MNTSRPDPVINIDAQAIRELDLSPLRSQMMRSMNEQLSEGAVLELRYQ